jgi:predicted transcriptional regulator
LQKAIHFVNNSKEIQLLANFKHQEILQLLSEHPMTQTELSQTLGLTKSAIGYHLKQLMQANLIYIKRVEVENHGIQQKFYSPIAAVIVANYDNIPKDVQRNFIQIQIERLRGIFTALQLQHRFSGISPENLEKLAIAMLKQLDKTCRGYKVKKVVKNAETLKIKIYAEALASLKKLDEWNTLINQKIS